MEPMEHITRPCFKCDFVTEIVPRENESLAPVSMKKILPRRVYIRIHFLLHLVSMYTCMYMSAINVYDS